MKNLFLSLSILFLSTNVFAGSSSLEVGDVAPCTTLTQLLPDGTQTHGCIADAAPNEKYVLLDFMSIECGACLADLPNIIQLAKDVKGLATVRQVSLDENVNDVTAWYSQKLKEGGISYAMALDPRNLSVKGYNINYTPTLYVLKKNVVVYAHIGVLKAKDVAEIKALVNQ